MSGIFGLFNQDGAPVLRHELVSMGSLLTRRGPEGTGIWLGGQVGLGHTKLATTPEAAFEKLPLAHEESGCVITADVRLDNRAELLRTLRLDHQASITGDGELLLAAYLAWGAACTERLLGDFTFAIWDPRQRRLLCARDHFGMRPVYYHHEAGRFVAFASEPGPILVLPQTHYRINEERIADYLIPDLEGVDKTSTFFEAIYRLPPAHTLTTTPSQIQVASYWSLEPGPELRLKSGDAYAEAFLDVFTEAVKCRLRGDNTVGSMLSGGIDSSSVVAVASDLLSRAGRGPLRTYSATSPDESTCLETRTIHAAQTIDGLDPQAVHYGQLNQLLPELSELSWSLDEPFDNHMTLPRVMYLAARRGGVKAMLDGVAADVVLWHGSHVARMLRAWRWLLAIRETAAQRRYWGDSFSAWREFYLTARVAFVPNPARHMYRRILAPQRCKNRVRDSIISGEFARRARVCERLQTYENWGASGTSGSYGIESVGFATHPNLTAGRERYGRVAAAVGIEPRDPFVDKRLVQFCASLPGDQRLSGGWPKFILRRAVATKLPESVRWRVGKEHLGWSFTKALMVDADERVKVDFAGAEGTISPYVDVTALRRACNAYFEARDMAQAPIVYTAVHLVYWLRRHTVRPSKPLAADS